MESETHNDNDQHMIIDIPNDDDSSSMDEGYSTARSSLSTDEERVESREGETSSTSGYANLWNLMELVITLVQIVAALVVSTLAKYKHPQALLLAWLIGYTCGCITNTLHLILSWRLHNKYNQVREHSRTRMDEDHEVVMRHLKIVIECFFVVWLVFGIVWICDDHSSPSDAPKLYRLCVVFIAFSCIRHPCPALLGAARVIFMIYTVSRLCGVSSAIMAVLSLLVDMLHGMMSSLRKYLGGGFVFKGPSHDDVASSNSVLESQLQCCCICLRKYEENKGVIRKLECSHVFHLECIDKWLRIKPTCRLCQSNVRG